MNAIFNSDIINPNLDLESIREEFKTKRVVVVKDFLREDVANYIHTYFTEEMPTDWWRISTCPKLNMDDGLDGPNMSGPDYWILRGRKDLR